MCVLVCIKIVCACIKSLPHTAQHACMLNPSPTSSMPRGRPGFLIARVICRCMPVCACWRSHACTRKSGLVYNPAGSRVSPVFRSFLKCSARSSSVSSSVALFPPHVLRSLRLAPPTLHPPPNRFLSIKASLKPASCKQVRRGETRQRL